MRRSLEVGMLLAAVLALAACAGMPGVPAPRVDAVPVDAVVCPETYEDGHAEGGAVPAGFEPVALLRCDPYASDMNADGTYAGARLERFEGDLSPVLEALATPNDPPATVCPAIGYMLPELWLEAVDGAVMRVALPRAGCGPKEVGLDAAIARLDRVSDEFIVGALVESTEAAAAGCATSAGMLVTRGANELPAEYRADDLEAETDLIPEENLIPLEPPPLPAPSAVSGARVCAYSVDTAADASTAPQPVGGDGRYTEVRRLDAPAAGKVLRLIGSAAAAEPCADTATRLVVVHPLLGDTVAPAVTVELDGCSRISDPGLRTLQAPPELIAALTP